MSTDIQTLLKRAKHLPCWSKPVEPKPLEGGLTNANLIVEDAGRAFVIRVSRDIPEHGIVRSIELSASRAAYDAGIGPEVLYAEPGIMVLCYIEGDTLTEEKIRQSSNISRIVPLLRKTHHEIPKVLDVPAVMFWPFHVNQHYLRLLQHSSCHLQEQLGDFIELNRDLEAAVVPFKPVFNHNDLLAANFIDDGARLWLIDWEYAGFNHPFFDLAGLSSNNQLSEQDENGLIEAYTQASVTKGTLNQFYLMKCASLLRETLWSCVCESTSSLDIDYVAYSIENNKRLEKALKQFKESSI